MTTIDPITLEIIENALRGTRAEMDAVLYSTAMSPAIREQHDEFPLLTDAKGDMIVGQFGSYVGGFIERYAGAILPGDIFFTNDPYSVEGAVSHLNDWMVLVPIFAGEKCVGWSSTLGHMADVGGPMPGSLPIDSASIFGEGTRIPPIKLYKQGTLDEELLSIMLANSRLPELNRSDLFALVAAARAGERRVIDLCDRFGREIYTAACDAMLKRTHDAMAVLIHAVIPQEPRTFEDWVDDDGVGNGPLRLRLTVWREGAKAIFDWTGTDPQSPGPINFLLHERLAKMFIGAMLIAAADPQIVFNDGYVDLLEVRIPPRTLLSPEFPAPLCNRLSVLARYTDVVSAAIGQGDPRFLPASCFGSAPNMLYHGHDDDGHELQLFEVGFGGIAGRPLGDGIDGHSVWPLFSSVPAESQEAYFPIRIESYRSLPDSGGAGLHRGGNGTEKTYVFLRPGEVTVIDDRWLTRPWGVLGGEPGGRSSKLIVRADGERTPVASKANGIAVAAGDSLVFTVWGGGGWGDPLERPAADVARDVRRGLVSVDAARNAYGVEFTDAAMTVDEEETTRRRDATGTARGEVALFNFGPSLDETLAHCKQETGLDPPRRVH
jgi:N-methylhydantoinase B